MRIDLRLQRHDSGVARVDLFKVDLLELLLQLRGHVIEGILHIVKLTAVGAFLDPGSIASLLDLTVGA